MVVSKGRVLAVLGAAQFLMVLDSAVMNVSISQLVEDFDTTVTSIQAVITFYALVMAALMITGGKLGDLWGRRRAFGIGMVIYACGSGLTAVSWSVPVLALGWSVLEGIGAALVLPAMVALVAGNFEGKSRAMAFGVLGGIAGVGIAVGPILGGFMTTYLSWRLVFAGEVVVAIAILLTLRWVAEAPREGPAPQLDVVGAVLSAVGLGLVVYGVLRSSTWGWLQPRDAPFEVFGFSPTLFVIAAGGVVLALFVAWQHHRERQGMDPLVRLDRLRIPPLRAGLQTFLAQNLILMGIFFIIPLYLQVVQGFDAFETGVRMLPVSVTLFLTALAGPILARHVGPRLVVRSGVGALVLASLLLLWRVEPDIDTVAFSVALAILGIGQGLVASQLGNVVQSSVDAEARSEAGGLQYTAQQFGGALGTALMGAIVIGGLASAFTDRIVNDPRISDAVEQQTTIALESGVQFVPADDVRIVATEAGLPPAEVDALVEDYEEAQVVALKSGLLVAAVIAIGAVFVTTNLPVRLAVGEPDEPATA